MDEQNEFVLDIASWKVKIENRSRNRMKFTIKMGRDETEAFSNFMEQLRPEHVTEDDFIRSIFYKGVEKFQEELMENMKSYLEENKEDIDASAMNELGTDASSLLSALAEKPKTQNIEIIED